MCHSRAILCGIIFCFGWKGFTCFQVSNVLSGMVGKLLETPSVRLLKHIVRCYLRLSEHARAREALCQCLPDALRDQSFSAVLRTEEAVQRWLALLIKNISTPAPPAAPAVEGGATPAIKTPFSAEKSSTAVPSAWTNK